MFSQSLYHTYKRYRTLQSHRIQTLPVVILMPHSACNCRCVMCDIWKDNKNLRQLRPEDVQQLLQALKKLDTKLVVMSGGEALLNPHFFRLCEILGEADISVSLLTTGLTLKKHAADIVRYVHDVIVSLDGDPETHNRIRNIPDAFQQLSEGVKAVKELRPSFPISGRSVIHRMNFRRWPAIIDAALGMGLDRISFLPADVSSHAFNREVLWSPERQSDLLPAEAELDEFRRILEQIIEAHSDLFENGFIAESPDKIRKMAVYYAAFYEHTGFPLKKCNAPWVSVVVEADGSVRPCFFHATIGNIHAQNLEAIVNSEEAIRFRRELDIMQNETCAKCVCYLNLKPGTSPV